MKVHFFCFVLLLQFLLIATVSQAQTVNLSIAASMTNALQEILGKFTIDNPDIVLRPNFASSGSLAKQIEQGAPVDIYVSANPKWMRYLVDKHLIAKQTVRILAYNKLVFIGKNQSPIRSIKKLPDLSRIALGSPKSVPAGQYAKQAMEKVDIYTTLRQKKKLIMAKDVRQALIYADRGEVDGAFVYRTDALLAINAEILFVVPDNLYDRVSYPLALTIRGTEKSQAKTLYDYMNSAEATAILTKYGFEATH